MDVHNSSFWFTVYHKNTQQWYACPHTMVYANSQTYENSTEEQEYIFQYLSSNWFSQKTKLRFGETNEDIQSLKFGIVETKKVKDTENIMNYVNHINTYLKRGIQEQYNSNFVRAFHMFKIDVDELCQQNDTQGRLCISSIASIIEDRTSFTSRNCDTLELEIHFRKLETDEVVISTPNLIVRTQ